MKRGIRVSRNVALAAVLAGALACLPQVSLAMGNPSAAAQSDSGAAAAVKSKLDKKQFQNVKVDVDHDGIATLTGTVSLYEYKVDAAHRAQKAKGINGVRNRIEVEGSPVSDQELQSKLGEKLAYDRVGYGNVFNAITLKVNDGVVTLGGHARTYVDRDSAVALASTYPGVKDVVDDIEVDPTSIMDDQTRFAVARAIYGYPALNKYAINPARPIRISVQNGHVELAGVVDNAQDKQLAYMRASQVPNVFSVKNDLQVAGAPAENSSEK